MLGTADGRGNLLRRVFFLGALIILVGSVVGAQLGDTAAPVLAQQAPPETLNGVLTTVWGYPRQSSSGSPQVLFFLYPGKGVRPIRLNLSRELFVAAGGLSSLNNRQVTVIGVRQDAASRSSASVTPLVFNVQSIRPSTASGPQLRAAQVVGTTRWVTILCRFRGQTGTPKFGRDHFDRMMGNSYPGMDNYFRTISYNTVNLTGSTSHGWYSLPLTLAEYSSSPDTLALMAEDCTRAADADVHFDQDPSIYGINLVFDEPMISAFGNLQAIDWIDSSRLFGLTWLYTDDDQNYYAHEMGHAYGMVHVSGGNWDPMGSSTCTLATAVYLGDEYKCVAPHYNGYNKRKAGLLTGHIRQQAISTTSPIHTLLA